MKQVVKKTVVVGLVVLLIAVTCATSYIIIYTLARPTRVQMLMQGVGVGDKIECEELEYDCWKDPLSYVSGFEAFAARVNPDDWITPEGWNRSRITLEEIAQANDMFIRKNDLQEMNADFFREFDEWCFVENGSEETFADWEYYIGLYSDDGYLAVYRGHDLSSELHLRL